VVSICVVLLEYLDYVQQKLKMEETAAPELGIVLQESCTHVLNVAALSQRH